MTNGVLTGMQKNWNSLMLLVGMQNGAAMLETVRQFP